MKNMAFSLAESMGVELAVSDDALKSLRLLTGGRKVLVVSDESCIRAGALALANIAVCDTVIFKDNIFPDEKAVENVLQNICECDMIVAIGTKTVIDIVKYCAFKEDIPYICVPTAANTTAQSTRFAEMFFNKASVNIRAKLPQAVIADTQILLKSPKIYKTAGLGVLLYSCCYAGEAHIASTVGEQDFDFDAISLIRQIADKSLKVLMTDSLNSASGINTLFYALFSLGLAMDSSLKIRTNKSTKNSSERGCFKGGAKLLSDHIQNICLFKGGTRGVEGETLGFACLCLDKLLPLASLRIRSKMNIAVQFSQKIWEKKISDIYGSAGAAIIESERKTRRNSIEQRRARIDKIYGSPNVLADILSGSETYRLAMECYIKEGGIADYKKLSLTLRELKEAVLYSKDSAPYYNVLQLASDLNILSEFASLLAK